MSARRRNASTEAVDNYLKAILSLGGTEESRVPITSLARHLSVAPASVTNMLQKLAAAQVPLVKYERHRGVQLSRTGKKRALEVVRHHRLIETFLYQVLEYPIEEIHAEAERLEHFISERFEERIAAKLGHPTIDPHGHSIPSLKGELIANRSILLADIVQAGTFCIDSLSDGDGRQLRWMKARGLAPGTRLQVTGPPSPAGFQLRVGRSRETFLLPREVARQVRIIATAGMPAQGSAGCDKLS